MARMNKTAFRDGYGYEPLKKVQTLSRSFDTLEEANKFAEGKQVTDIYRAAGRFKVEWLKTTEVKFDD